MDRYPPVWPITESTSFQKQLNDLQPGEARLLKCNNNLLTAEQMSSIAELGELRSDKIQSTQAVIVTGMHRSGTSALTRVLNLLGCVLAGEVLGPGDGNERGHWESLEAVRLNDEILESAGSNWQDWGAINEDWRNSSLRSVTIDKIAKLVKNQATLGPLIAIKDPRICRLVDLWIEAMMSENIEPLVILMVRNPLEVAASLGHRDLMTPGYAQLLWLRHVLDAEYLSRGRRRVVCRYDELLSNWGGVVGKIKYKLGITFPRNVPATHLQIEEFLNSDHRHHEASADAALNDSSVSSWLRSTYAIMLDWSVNGESLSHHEEFDAIRNSFDQAYEALARLLLPISASSQAGLGFALRRELEEQAVAVQLAAEQAQTRADELEALKVAAASRQAELEGQIAASASALVQRQEELAQLWKQLLEAEKISSAAQATTKQELERRLESEAALERATDDLRRSATEALNLSKKVGDLVLAVNDAEAARSEVEGKLADRFDELARLTAILSEEANNAIIVEVEAQWLRDVRRLEESFPAWWAIMPHWWRQRRIHRRFRRAGLFDGEAYINLYPDVAEEGMDPIRHYILHGMDEGRTRPILT